MGLLMRWVFAAMMAVLSAAASALTWDLDLDARAVAVDGEKSFLDGGLDKFRYSDGNAIKLGRARLALEQRLGDKFRVVVDASAWGDGGPHPFDLTEAFVEYRSYPHDAWRVRVRAGAFYPPSSLENRAAGWESPYSISFSALNTWIAEEIRPTGAEIAIDHLGTKQGQAFDWGVFGSVYGWNDPAGTLVAKHGFALDDRQSRLHDFIGWHSNGPVSNNQLFYEIDNRAGFYLGGKVRIPEGFEARGMHYDNRADGSILKATIGDFAWRTYFDTVGLRLETAGGQTWLAQGLRGVTNAVPFFTYVRWEFSTWNLLVNQRWGAHGLSLRYDDFKSVQTAPAPVDWKDRGTAWTLAYGYEREGAPWRFMAEYVRVDSTASDRLAILGTPPQLIESKLELSLRYRFTNQHSRQHDQ